MEPPTTGQKAIGHDESPVHTWRVSRLERLGVPGPLAEIYADRIDWHQIAQLMRRGCPQGSPSGLSADIGREDPSDDRPRDLA
jgi:hypothetical protein